MPPIVTLLTDFGLADSYVAEVKAVLLWRAPDVTLVDITHQVPPGDLRAAQYLLSRAWHRFPRDTVHLAVVDPGVGSDRRALAAQAAGHGFVAPDNGLLSFLPADARFVALTVPPAASPTFHGRDVFAPAAARLARGAPLADLGAPVTDPYRSPLPAPRAEENGWLGEVIYVDSFGTLVTNLPGSAIAAGAGILVSGRDAGPLRRTFADVARGGLVVYVGSGGSIEIAVREGSAARLLGVGAGESVKTAVR
ncbi:MAG: SAM hydrolase/SAM-dependent halogenase family protein [Gemmatimonadales bacterium]